MKIVKCYSDDFKREVTQHYLTSDDRMQVTADKFKVPVHASVGQWVRKFGGEFRTSVMNEPPEKSKNEPPDTFESMARRIKELEEALQRERLMNLATNKMIDVAERDLNISIKKSLESSSGRNKRIVSRAKH